MFGRKRKLQSDANNSTRENFFNLDDASQASDYEELRAIYLEADHLTCARVSARSKAYKVLYSKIMELEKGGDHQEVFVLLQELRRFETTPPTLGGATASWQYPSSSSASGGDVQLVGRLEVVREEVEIQRFIADVLLTRVVRVKPDPDGPGATVQIDAAAPAQYPAAVQSMPTDEFKGASAASFPAVNLNAVELVQSWVRSSRKSTSTLPGSYGPAHDVFCSIVGGAWSKRPNF